MKTKHPESATAFVDPDDAPVLTDEQLDRAELAIGGKVIRPATGTLTRGRGRPKLASAKQLVSLRLEPDVVEVFRASGPGWQTRMGDVIRASITRDDVTGHPLPAQAGRTRRKA